MSSFLSIDLTSSEKRPSAYAVLGGEWKVLGLGFLGGDEDILKASERYRPQIIAIDAPLGLPKGLCCLEEACPCQPQSPLKGRVSERELARRGIGCFFTTKKSIIKKMVYRGMALRARLLALGFEVIEVYPYATKVRLFGRPIPPKLKPGGLDFLKRRLLELLPALSPYLERLDHNLCDALLAAYTAYLHHEGRAEAIGAPEEDLLFLPLEPRILRLA